jgi:hypothetical protein
MRLTRKMSSSTSMLWSSASMRSVARKKNGGAPAGVDAEFPALDPPDFLV